MTDYEVTQLPPYPDDTAVAQESINTALFRPFVAFTPPRTGKEAEAWGRAQITKREAPTSDGTWYRWCLVFVRSCFGIPARWLDAGKAWDNAERKHPTNDPMAIPAHVPVWWELPSVADHIAYSIGNGLCLSNDAKRPGHIDVVSIDSITRNWGGRLLGWAEDLNGVTVWAPPPPPPPVRPAKGPLKPIRKALNVAARAADSARRPGLAKRIRRLRDNHAKP